MEFIVENAAQYLIVENANIGNNTIKYVYEDAIGNTEVMSIELTGVTGITAVSVTPTELMNTPVLDALKLRMVMCCGEVCNPDIFMQWAGTRKRRAFRVSVPNLCYFLLL